MGNDNDDNKDDRSEEDDVTITCCKHGRPCQLAESKKRHQQKGRSDYEALPPLDPSLKSCRVDADLGSEEGGVDSTVMTDDWDSNAEIESIGNLYENVDKIETISTAKESSQGKLVDVASTDSDKPRPKEFERSKTEAEIVKQCGGNRSEATAASHSFTTMDSADDRVNTKEQQRLLGFYMGFRTKEEAEKRTRRGFRLYHHVDDSDEDFLQSTLSLFIVYRTVGGDYRHIPIRRVGKDSLRVDIEGEPKFQSLDQLITFYDIYASLDNNMEPFPNRRCLDENMDTASQRSK